jgi:hypothetical protein
MYSGTSSVPKISFGSRSRLESKKDESRDYNQNQEKGMRREDYSRTVRFFDGKLFSSSGYIPLSAMALGVFFWKRRTRGREMMEVYANRFAEHQMCYFISRGSALGVMTGWRALMGIPNGRVFPWMRRVFSLNSVHGPRIRIFCGFYAKVQEFVHIRLEEKFPNAFKAVKIRMHKIKEVITKQIQKIKFHLYCRNSIAPSTN